MPGIDGFERKDLLWERFHATMSHTRESIIAAIPDAVGQPATGRHGVRRRDAHRPADSLLPAVRARAPAGATRPGQIEEHLA